MSNVVVLTGGTSSEREICFRSAAAIERALRRRGHDVTTLDYAEGVAPHAAALRAADCVVPALHGKGGEDGTLQAELERLGVPFVGSDSAASALCMDKWRFKRHVAGRVPVPGGEMVDADGLWRSELTKAPFVLKPNDGGSSIDTFLVPDPANADRTAMLDALARNGPMLLEELIPGIELTVGVLGDEALPVIEIIPPPDGEFDYENKYNGRTQEICPPAHIAPDRQRVAQELAVLTHRLCGCRDLSRADLILTPAGDLYVMETNTFPGMTDQSLYPKEAAVAGIPMDELLDRFVRMALARARRGGRA
jgi:D-alanine-D-alanine ligase